MYKELIGGGGLLAIILSLFGYTMNRINNISRKLVTQEICMEKHGQLRERMSKSEDRSKDLETKLDEFLRVLIRVETKLTMFMDENGFGRSRNE